MQIITGNTEKKQIMEQVIQCHLGVDGDPPDRHRIASHHWLLALLQWQLKVKNCHWMNPLTRQEATQLGTSCNIIDCHPNSNDNNNGTVLV